MAGFLKVEVTGYVGGSDGRRDTKTRCGGTPGCLQRVGKWDFCLLSWDLWGGAGLGRPCPGAFLTRETPMRMNCTSFGGAGFSFSLREEFTV